MNSKSISVAIAAVGLLLSAGAGAVEPVDKFQVSLGSYLVNHDVDLQWNSPELGAGSRINFKRDLGFDDSESDYIWSLGGTIGQHHKLSAFGYRYDSDGERLLAEDFVIDDAEFPSEAAFAGHLDVKVTGIAYTWLFHHGERSAAGVGIGAVRYDVSADLAAASLTGEGTVTIEKKLAEDAWAPMLRAEYNRSLAEHWRMGGQISYVKKSGGDTSGDAIDANVRLEYFPWENFGFGLHYNYNDVDLDFDRSRFNGSVNLKNRGPQLVATLRF
ncbi:MAG: hypothetical protein QM795_13995 [Pseudoxanthomonas sp.]